MNNPSNHRGRFARPSGPEIRRSSSFVELVSPYVPGGLTERTRGDFWGLCPFHDEQTPSFHVREDLRLFKCFGCGVGGDDIAFLRRVGLSFRDAVEAVGGGCATPRRARRAPTTKPKDSAPKRPGFGEVQDLRAVLTKVTEDDEVSSFLLGRGIDPDAVASRDLAYALPLNAECPSWARIKGRPWATQGYRLLVPVYAPGAGGPVGFRARRVIEATGADAANEPKAAAPSGVSLKGCVMADALGRYLLGYREPPSDWPRGVPLVAWTPEGETDFLSLATHWSDCPTSPAVFGVVSGAWTAEIAACLPMDAIVEVATDNDAAGHAMAVAIGRTLGRRRSDRRFPGELS